MKQWHVGCHTRTVAYRVLSAFFYRRGDAEDALRQLAAMGVSSECISLVPGHAGRRDDLVVLARTKAADGAVLGVVTGGAIGATLGALGAGGSLIAPVLGVVVAGPLVGALTVAAMLGLAGMSMGALIGALTPDYEARYVADAVRVGGALMAVRCFDGDGAVVQRALEQSGARRLRWERTQT
jgi:hypothetical protein